MSDTVSPLHIVKVSRLETLCLEPLTLTTGKIADIMLETRVDIGRREYLGRECLGIGDVLL